ncbi:MAG: hypothetical protein CIT03_05150 [Methanobacterium sp.]|nr:MAG: hypothetical protein CIT03_05150 [Methanobacterium sp.]
MDFLFLWPGLTLMVIILMLIRNRNNLNTHKVFEILLIPALVLLVGFGSIWAFIGHFFLSAQIAASIGWPAGSPFQLEVAFANLAFGILGILCWKFRDNFWTATIIGVTTFYWGATYVHIMDIINTGNFAPGNAGIALYIDIIIPLALIILLIGYKKTIPQKK